MFLQHADFIVGGHDGNENRLGPNRVGHLLWVQDAALRRVDRCRFQKGYLQNHDGSGVERIQHRLVLRCNANEVIPLLSRAVSDSLDRQVVAFRRPAGEDDLAFPGV